ncbi:GntR family transcriptional regulator [Streptomyces erythrochromogenes]|uniref:GntR family transcriptional regulator n=1 Tax=Streptomyces erythrochromogenes TaxID=285574 RepID=UPI00224FD588|nr:GntR family transcriptional regulator [Streptomyces erythrochromogenes]MCX5586786.1 GntR family transcriptional regulator [Streptomyces erythrochromogenes]
MPTRRHAIADDLRHQISSGHFAPGERLPSETQLATHYTVSTSTLRSALALLQSEGLVEKIHGNGNFVRRPLCRITYTGGTAALAPWTAFSAPLRMTARTTNIEAPNHLTALLGVPPRTPLTEILFTTHEGKAPHSLAYTYVPHDLAPAAPPLPEQIAVGLADRCSAPSEVRERVSARLPTQEEATVLRISSSLAVISLIRVATDATGRVVEAALFVLPGDRADALFTTRVAEERSPKA